MHTARSTLKGGLKLAKLLAREDVTKSGTNLGFERLDLLLLGSVELKVASNEWRNDLADLGPVHHPAGPVGRAPRVTWRRSAGAIRRSAGAIRRSAGATEAAATHPCAGAHATPAAAAHPGHAAPPAAHPRPNLVVLDLAIVVRVERLERSGRVLDFIGRERAVVVRVERIEERPRTHRSARSARKLARATTTPGTIRARSRQWIRTLGLRQRGRSHKRPNREQSLQSKSSHRSSSPSRATVPSGKRLRQAHTGDYAEANLKRT